MSLPALPPPYRHLSGSDSYPLTRNHLPPEAIRLLERQQFPLRVKRWIGKEKATGLPHGIHIVYYPLENKLSVYVAIQRQVISDLGELLRSYSVSEFSYSNRQPLDHVLCHGCCAPVQASLSRLHTQLLEYNRS